MQNQKPTFKKAEKRAVKLKIALTGPAGSGKTFSALQIATGLGGKIALIDTENASASLYADQFQFDTMEIDPPYTVQKYNEAIQAAVDGKYDVVIIDSISHAWAGEGGLLQKKESLDSRGGNQYANWAPITKEHEALKAKILSSDVHMICTMRSKQEYALQEDEKGRKQVKKLGMAPVQRDGMEYEFTAVLDMAMDHSAQASKDRTRLFDGKLFRPDTATGKALMEWLNSSAAQTKAPDVQSAAKAGPEDIGFFSQKLEHRKDAGWTGENFMKYLSQAYGAKRLSELDKARVPEVGKVIDGMSFHDAMKGLTPAQETLQ